MSVFKKTGSFLANIFGERTATPAPPAPIEAVESVRVPTNDAEAFGITIVPAAAAPGVWYYQAVSIHHLTPAENNGNHHLFIDVLDPTRAADKGLRHDRLYGARVRVSWEGGEQNVVIDKPTNEPGAHFPMWKWQECSVEVIGLPGESLASDRVSGIHTGHPDEETGNTLFHHSFEVVFCKVQAPETPLYESVVQGIIRGAARRKILLTLDDETLTTQLAADDGAFRFAELGAGSYAVKVENTRLTSDPVILNGKNQVTLTLDLVPNESCLTGKVHRGAGLTLVLLRDSSEVARQVVASDQTYRFENLRGGVYRVALLGREVIGRDVTLNGISAASLDLVALEPEKPLAHYVLFGPAEHPRTEVNLRLAQDYLLAFKPTFGFTAEEASGATLVTIIADLTEVDRDTEQRLAEGGAVIQRVGGSPEEVAASLSDRIAHGVPFA